MVFVRMSHTEGLQQLSVARRRSLRGNVIFPQHRLGYSTYALQALFSEQDPLRAIEDFVQRDDTVDEEIVAKKALAAHTAFKVGRRRFWLLGKFIPIDVASDIPMLVRYEKKYVLGAAAYMLNGTYAYTAAGGLEVLRKALTDPEAPVELIRACLTEAVNVMERDPRVTRRLKAFKRKFHFNTFHRGDTANSIAENIIKTTAKNLKKRLSENEASTAADILHRLEWAPTIY